MLATKSCKSLLILCSVQDILYTFQATDIPSILGKSLRFRALTLTHWSGNWPLSNLTETGIRKF